MEGADDRRKRLKAMRAEAEANNGNDLGGVTAGKQREWLKCGISRAGRVVPRPYEINCAVLRQMLALQSYRTPWQTAAGQRRQHQTPRPLHSTGAVLPAVALLCILVSCVLCVDCCGGE